MIINVSVFEGLKNIEPYLVLPQGIYLYFPVVVDNMR
jgi:hypothetical protein